MLTLPLPCPFPTPQAGAYSDFEELLSDCREEGHALVEACLAAQVRGGLLAHWPRLMSNAEPLWGSGCSQAKPPTELPPPPPTTTTTTTTTTSTTPTPTHPTSGFRAWRCGGGAWWRPSRRLCSCWAPPLRAC